MDQDLNQFAPQNGMDVIGADGEKVGEIDGVERDYFIVRKGFFFPQDHYIPMTAISSFDDNQVFLNVTKDEALEQEWTNEPGAVSHGSTAMDSDNVVYDDTELPTDDDGAVIQDTNIVGQIDNTTDQTYREGDDPLVGMDTSATSQGGVDVDHNDQTIDVHQEELVANKREVDRGAVRVNKNVVEEQQTLEVPVTEEAVQVTRRPVDRDVNVDDHAFEEGTIEVPLRGEEVNVEKRSRVVEEIDIDKTATTHNERVSDTVRHEEVNIEGDNVDVNDARNPDTLRADNGEALI